MYKYSCLTPLFFREQLDLLHAHPFHELMPTPSITKLYLYLLLNGMRLVDMKEITYVIQRKLCMLLENTRKYLGSNLQQDTTELLRSQPCNRNPFTGTLADIMRKKFFLQAYLK
jgi:hypothetical protein